MKSSQQKLLPSRQDVSRRKSNRRRRSVKINPSGKMFCDLGPNEARYNWLKLESIIQELNLSIKESEKHEKERVEDRKRLKCMAMALMEPGTEFRTELGVLNFRKTPIPKCFSKTKLEKTLILSGFSGELVKELKEVSIDGIRTRDYVTFSITESKEVE